MLFAPVGGAVGGAGQRKLAVDAVSAEDHRRANHMGGELFFVQPARRDLRQTGAFDRDHKRPALTVFFPIGHELVHPVQGTLVKLLFRQAVEVTGVESDTVKEVPRIRVFQERYGEYRITPRHHDFGVRGQLTDFRGSDLYVFLELLETLPLFGGHRFFAFAIELRQVAFGADAARFRENIHVDRFDDITLAQQVIAQILRNIRQRDIDPGTVGVSPEIFHPVAPDKVLYFAPLQGGHIMRGRFHAELAQQENRILIAQRQVPPLPVPIAEHESFGVERTSFVFAAAQQRQRPFKIPAIGVQHDPVPAEFLQRQVETGHDFLSGRYIHRLAERLFLLLIKALGSQFQLDFAVRTGPVMKLHPVGGLRRFQPDIAELLRVERNVNRGGLQRHRIHLYAGRQATPVHAVMQRVGISAVDLNVAGQFDFNDLAIAEFLQFARRHRNPDDLKPVTEFDRLGAEIFRETGTGPEELRSHPRYPVFALRTGRQQVNGGELPVGNPKLNPGRIAAERPAPAAAETTVVRVFITGHGAFANPGTPKVDAVVSGIAAGGDFERNAVHFADGAGRRIRRVITPAEVHRQEPPVIIRNRFQPGSLQFAAGRQGNPQFIAVKVIGDVALVQQNPVQIPAALAALNFQRNREKFPADVAPMQAREIIVPIQHDGRVGEALPDLSVRIVIGAVPPVFDFPRGLSGRRAMVPVNVFVAFDNGKVLTAAAGMDGKRRVGGQLHRHDEPHSVAQRRIQFEDRRTGAGVDCAVSVNFHRRVRRHGGVADAGAFRQGNIQQTGGNGSGSEKNR